MLLCCFIKKQTTWAVTIVVVVRKSRIAISLTVKKSSSPYPEVLYKYESAYFSYQYSCFLELEFLSILIGIDPFEYIMVLLLIIYFHLCVASSCCALSALASSLPNFFSPISRRKYWITFGFCSSSFRERNYEKCLQFIKIRVKVMLRHREIA